MAKFDFNSSDVEWLLLAIHNLNELYSGYRTYGNLPTHKNIWRGSYDVWFCEQDKIDAVEIPKSRMKQAKNDGFIVSEKITFDNREYDIWKLTASGKQLIKKYI